MRSKLLSLGAFLSVGLAACSSSGNSGPSYSSTVDSATAALAGTDAADFASTLADAMISGLPNTPINDFLPAKGASTSTIAQRVIQHLRAEAYARGHLTAPSGSPMLAAPNMSAPFSTCTPNVTGIDVDSLPIDVNNNGVPDDYTLTFPANCIVSDSAGTFSTLFSGSFHVHDLGGLYAYRLDVGNLKVKTTNLATSEYEQIGANGFETATYTVTGISHQTDMTYAIAFTSGGAPAPAMASGPQAVSPTLTNLSFVYKETSSYAPDGSISLANPIPSGDLSFDFDYRILASSTGQTDQNFRFTMHTGTVLHYDNSSCYGITSGAVHGELNGGTTAGFDITWTGCGAFTVTTFGTTEPTA